MIPAWRGSGPSFELEIILGRLPSLTVEMVPVGLIGEFLLDEIAFQQLDCVFALRHIACLEQFGESRLSDEFSLQQLLSDGAEKLLDLRCQLRLRLHHCFHEPHELLGLIDVSINYFHQLFVHRIPNDLLVLDVADIELLPGLFVELLLLVDDAPSVKQIVVKHLLELRVHSH